MSRLDLILGLPAASTVDEDRLNALGEALSGVSDVRVNLLATSIWPRFVVDLAILRNDQHRCTGIIENAHAQKVLATSYGISKPACRIRPYGRGMDIVGRRKRQ